MLQVLILTFVLILNSIPMKKVYLALFLAITMFLTACTDADIASSNLSRAADSFEVLRRVVFYNGITSEYIFVLEGYCSLGNYDEPGKLSVTCKTGSGQYKKHFLGLSDNVTFFAEQLDSNAVSADHYRVVFKPAAIIPDIDLQ